MKWPFVCRQVCPILWIFQRNLPKYWIFMDANRVMGPLPATVCSRDVLPNEGCGSFSFITEDGIITMVWWILWRTIAALLWIAQLRAYSQILSGMVYLRIHLLYGEVNLAGLLWLNEIKVRWGAIIIWKDLTSGWPVEELRVGWLMERPTPWDTMLRRTEPMWMICTLHFYIF